MRGVGTPGRKVDSGVVFFLESVLQRVGDEFAGGERSCKDCGVAERWNGTVQLERITIPRGSPSPAARRRSQRSGVTVTLHTLEGAGMIHTTRGPVTIRDRAKLEDIAGNSYGIRAAIPRPDRAIRKIALKRA